MSNYLIVAPCFPPDKSVATVRMASLVNYLIQKGENIVVVTNKKDMEMEIKDSHLRYIFVNANTSQSGLKIFNENAKKYKNIVSKILDGNAFKCMLVSMGPYYTYELSLLAKRKKTRCVMDFRDPWVFDYRGAKSFFTLKNLLGLLLKIPRERCCINAASAVTTVTERWLEAFKKLYPFQKSKFQLIENGYDDFLLKKIKLSYPDKTSDVPFTLGVFGKLFYYTDKYSRVFLKALNTIDKNCCVIKQIGVREDNTNVLLEEFNIPESMIQSTGFMKYTDGIFELNKCNAFLMIDGRKSAVGTKIYDYVYLGKPIIYVGPKNTVISNIVKNLCNGIVCSTSREVGDAIRNVMNGKYEDCLPNMQYARKTQNEKFYSLLNE